MLNVILKDYYHVQLNDECSAFQRVAHTPQASESLCSQGWGKFIKHAKSWAPAQTYSSSTFEAGPRNLHNSQVPQMIQTCFHLSKSLGSCICFLLSLHSYFLLSHLYCVHVSDHQLPEISLEARQQSRYKTSYMTRCPSNPPLPL